MEVPCCFVAQFAKPPAAAAWSGYSELLDSYLKVYRCATRSAGSSMAKSHGRIDGHGNACAPKP